MAEAFSSLKYLFVELLRHEKCQTSVQKLRKSFSDRVFIYIQIHLHEKTDTIFFVSQPSLINFYGIVLIVVLRLQCFLRIFCLVVQRTSAKSSNNNSMSGSTMGVGL